MFVLFNVIFFKHISIAKKYKFMKTLKKLCLVLLVFVYTNALSAQKGIEIETVFGTNYSKALVSEDIPSSFQIKQNINFGLRGNVYLSQNIYLTTGFLYHQTGTDVSAYLIDPMTFLPTDELLIIGWKANTIAVPLKLGYFFYDSKNIRLGAEAGFLNMIVGKQESTYNGSSFELDPKVFNDLIISVDLSFDFGIKINERMMVHLRPKWAKQINGDQFKIVHYGIDGGFSYRIF